VGEWVTWLVRLPRHSVSRVISISRTLCQHITNLINMSRTLSSTHKVFKLFTYHVECHTAKTVYESHLKTSQHHELCQHVTNSINISRTVSNTRKNVRVIYISRGVSYCQNSWYDYQHVTNSIKYSRHESFTYRGRVTLQRRSVGAIFEGVYRCDDLW